MCLCVRVEMVKERWLCLCVRVEMVKEIWLGVYVLG